MNENELIHYGRKGMKWYQHIFGEIDKRAAYASAKLKAASDAANALKKANASVSKDKELASNKAALRRLSDAELQARINRLNMEKQYRELVLGPQKEKTHKGRDIVLDVIASFGKTAASSLGKAYGEEKGEGYKREKKEARDEAKRKEDIHKAAVKALAEYRAKKKEERS